MKQLIYNHIKKLEGTRMIQSHKALKTYYRSRRKITLIHRFSNEFSIYRITFEYFIYKQNENTDYYKSLLDSRYEQILIVVGDMEITKPNLYQRFVIRRSAMRTHNTMEILIDLKEQMNSIKSGYSTEDYIYHVKRDKWIGVTCEDKIPQLEGKDFVNRFKVLDDFLRDINVFGGSTNYYRCIKDREIRTYYQQIIRIPILSRVMEHKLIVYSSCIPIDSLGYYNSDIDPIYILKISSQGIMNRNNTYAPTGFSPGGLVQNVINEPNYEECCSNVDKELLEEEKQRRTLQTSSCRDFRCYVCVLTRYRLIKPTNLLLQSDPLAQKDLIYHWWT